MSGDPSNPRAASKDPSRKIDLVPNCWKSWVDRTRVSVRIDGGGGGGGGRDSGSDDVGTFKLTAHHFRSPTTRDSQPEISQKSEKKTVILKSAAAASAR